MKKLLLCLVLGVSVSLVGCETKPTTKAGAATKSGDGKNEPKPGAGTDTKPPVGGGETKPPMPGIPTGSGLGGGSTTGGSKPTLPGIPTKP